METNNKNITKKQSIIKNREKIRKLTPQLKVLLHQVDKHPQGQKQN